MAGSTADFERSGTISTSAGFDVIGLLPARASERLRQLRQMARDAHSLLPEFADRLAANSARGDAERRLQRLLAPRAANGFNLDPTDNSVIEQRRLVQKLTDEAQRLSELDQVRTEAWRSASRVVSSIESYLRDGRPPATVLQDYDGPEPKLLKGETITDAIERLRRRVRELKADAHRISSSCFPSAYCKQRMRGQVEALATLGASSVSPLVEFDRDIAWPTQRVTSSILNAQPGPVGFAELEAAVPLLVWLHKEALIKRLDAEIDAEADDKASLSHEARQQQEAEVMDDLLAVERDESALVWRAMMDDRLPVEHRNDCSPQAILQLSLIAAPRTNNGSLGSGAMHAWDIVRGRR
jgi:hypothetical protein